MIKARGCVFKRKKMLRKENFDTFLIRTFAFLMGKVHVWAASKNPCHANFMRNLYLANDYKMLDLKNEVF